MSTPANEAMHTGSAIEGRCNARNRNGTLCKRPAGWGTQHHGAGRCSYHTGSTSNGIKAAAKEVLQDAAKQLGISLEMEPHDLMLAAVHATAGQLAFAQARAAQVKPEDVQGSYWVELQGQALDRAARVSKAAMDAGIAERRVRLAERTGALIAAAIEDAMGEMPEHFSPVVRTEFARRVQGRLAVLERTDGDGPE